MARRKHKRRHPAQVRFEDELDQIERWTGNAKVSVSEWAAARDDLHEQSLACCALLRLNRIHRETISLMEKLKIKVG